MKRFISLLILGLFALSLTSCSLFGNNDDASVTAYEKIYVADSTEELQDAVSKVSGSNVVLATYYKKSSGSGIFSKSSYVYNLKSAVIYKNDNSKYYLVTEYTSGDEAAKSYSVIINANYENPIEATMVGYDVINRVAVYKFTSYETYSVSEISEEYDNSIGDMVFSLATQSMDVSSISSFDFEQYYSNLYTGIIGLDNGLELMTDTMSSDDNRGSGLYDYTGKLVGLNIYKVSTTIEYGASYSEGQEGLLDTSGMCYAIRCDKLYTIVSQIEAEFKVIRLSVGFDIKTTRELNEYYCDYAIYSYYLREYAYVYGLDTQPYIDWAYGNDKAFEFPDGISFGLYLYATGTTSDFSLQKGDFIVGINGVEVRSLYDFLSIFNLLLSTDDVVLSIYRNGSPMTLSN